MHLYLNGAELHCTIILLDHMHISCSPFPIPQVYSYDFDLMSPPVRAYQLVPGATGAILTDKMIFVISHDDEIDPLAVSVCVCVCECVRVIASFIFILESL